MRTDRHAQGIRNPEIQFAPRCCCIRLSTRQSTCILGSVATAKPCRLRSDHVSSASVQIRAEPSGVPRAAPVRREHLCKCPFFLCMPHCVRNTNLGRIPCLEVHHTAFPRWLTQPMLASPASDCLLRNDCRGHGCQFFLAIVRIWYRTSVLSQASVSHLGEMLCDAALLNNIKEARVRLLCQFVPHLKVCWCQDDAIERTGLLGTCLPEG